MIQTDGKTTTLAADGAVFGGPARIIGIYYVASATAGSIVIKDGGASGTTLINVATPASATATSYVDLSAAPVRCQTSAYADITNVTSITVLYA